MGNDGLGFFAGMAAGSFFNDNSDIKESTEKIQKDASEMRRLLEEQRGKLENVRDREFESRRRMDGEISQTISQVSGQIYDLEKKIDLLLSCVDKIYILAKRQFWHLVINRGVVDTEISKKVNENNAILLKIAKENGIDEVEYEYVDNQFQLNGFGKDSKDAEDGEDGEGNGENMEFISNPDPKKKTIKITIQDGKAHEESGS